VGAGRRRHGLLCVARAWAWSWSTLAAWLEILGDVFGINGVVRALFSGELWASLAGVVISVPAVW
jgi:hypothetical protein